MSKEDLIKEIDSVEVWSVFNKHRIVEAIEKAYINLEITALEKTELHTYTANAEERALGRRWQ